MTLSKEQRAQLGIGQSPGTGIEQRLEGVIELLIDIRDRLASQSPSPIPPPEGEISLREPESEVIASMQRSMRGETEPETPTRRGKGSKA